ncbi:LacI family transcriptional regulator [Synergistales bacterium]|nr:LacI family transcriptional regulator [Synergistales bacterium]
MKKVFAVIFTFLALFSIVVCSAPALAAPLITVGFVQTNTNESDWRTANTKSMQTALTKEAGFDLKIVFGEGSHEKQVADAQALIQEEVDYLVIAGIQSSGWESVARSAKDAGIPLIMVDRKLDLAEDMYTAMVCSDFEAEGKKATDWLKAQNKGEYNIVHIQGDAGSSAQLGRSKALKDAAAANGWKIVHQQAMKGWDEGLATAEVTNVIDAGTKFNVIFSENDNMARGAETAMDNAGITYGKNGSVIVIAFDANKWALQLVVDGKFNLDVECNPLHGPRIVKLINDIEAGKPVDKNAYVDEEIFDSATITQAIVDARPY